jgi:NAD(P)-dependent dehydrogenase (short-subunit alcohol dehydrogenase family)
VKPVCLVIGAGAGIGGNVARRFAQEGYHACLCRRTDEAGLNKLVESIEREGGSATGYLLNAVEPDSIEERLAAIESDIGPIEVVVYNLGAQIGDRSLADTSYKAFERCWRLATLPADGRAWQGNNPGDLGNCCNAWQRGPTCARVGYGRATHAVSVAQCGVLAEGNPRRAYSDRRLR